MKTAQQFQAGKGLALAVALSLISNPVLAAESCPVQVDKIKEKLASFSQKTEKEEKELKDEHAKATSSNYSKDYFKKFEELNKNAQEAHKLVNTAYKLTGFTEPMALGEIQSKLPTKVTHTMSNAVELAQAAMNEDNTKLDLAQLRCGQSTEDTALSAYLDQADSNTVSKYKSTKKNACKLVHILADLQDKKQKLDDIRENGYPLFYLHAKEKKTFAGSYKRTIQLKADLRMYPIYNPSNTKNVDGGAAHNQPFLLGNFKGIDLSYNSYFKFSDNNWTKLNLYQYVISDTQKGEICQPKINFTSSVKVALCSKVEDVSVDGIKLKVRAKYWYKGDSSAVSLGTKTIPAPFGYLADLSDMKEKKMEEVKSKLVKRAASVLGEYSEVIEKAQQWKKSCS